MAKRPKLLLGEDDPTAGIIPGCEFLPQWYDDDLDLQYGPSLNGYQTQCRDWKQSIHSGGLWDEDEFRRCGGGRLVSDKGGLGRYDFDTVSAFMAKRSHELPRRYQEAYVLFFVNRCTYSQTADSMKVSVEAAKKIVNRLRRRAREG